MERETHKGESMTNLKLKKVKDQVIVIMGASSGIGLATARLAAKRGAKLVLVARNAAELQRLKQEIERMGAQVEAIPADVADDIAVQKVADAAITRFGRIDTWINNASISIYGKLTEVPMEEKRRMFDINFWGVVHGCKAAVRKLQSSGGAIINVGSILSERAIPLQGMYCAAKHAVKAYTDTLRMELEAEGYPISVTLVKPAAIDTPFTLHARNHIVRNGRKVQPVHTAPVYSPEVAAKAILTCAENPVRDVYVGGSAKFYSLVEKFAPRIGDLYMERKMMEEDQTLDEEVGRDQEALFNSKHDGDERGNYPGHVMRTSLYTSASLHPVATALLAGGLTTLATAIIARQKKGNGGLRDAA